MTWQVRCLSEIADLSLGKMLDQRKNRGDFLPYLANVNVRWGELDLSNLRQMRFEAHEADRYGLKFGDIVMCEGGEPGRCALWRDTQPGPMLQKALHRIRPRSGIEPAFLYYALSHLGRGGYMSQFFTGATIKHLPAEKLAKVEVRVPLFSDQRRIASVLTAYDELIENNQRRIRILEEMARTLYREWFVHFRFPGHESHPRVPSPLGEIPKGWEVCALEEIASITMGLSPKGNTYNDSGVGMPLVNGPVEFGERFTKSVKWTTSPTKVCSKGDLIVCVRGSTTGRYVKSDGTYCLGRGVCSISSRYQSYVYLLYIHLAPLLLSQTGGSTFPSWTGPQLKSVMVAAPPTTLLEKFEALVSPMLEAADLYSGQNQNLRATRDLLLPRLLSGQIKLEAN